MIVASCMCICIRTWRTVYFVPTARYHILGTKSWLPFLREDAAKRDIDDVDLSHKLG